MFYVYPLASKPYGTVYVGLTTEFARRVWSTRLGVSSAPNSGQAPKRTLLTQRTQRVRRGREGDRLPLRPSRILRDLCVKAFIFCNYQAV
jgi:hypothetical protein